MSFVARLSIAPVKALALQHPAEIRLTERGAADDRRFYIIDAHGRLLDGTRQGTLVAVVARTDPDASHLELRFPDGRTVDGPVATGEQVATHAYGHVLDGEEVLGPWTAALAEYAGQPVRLMRLRRPGGAEPDRVVSIVSWASVDALAQATNDGVPLDARRFRMLVELDGCGPFEEDTWLGQRIRIGDAEVHVVKPDARCVVTTQDPDTGVRDFDTLRAIRRVRGLRDGSALDFGVLGRVERGGVIRVGDPVARVADEVPAPGASG